MATRDLRDELAAIPGVSDAEITMADDDPPTASVWLDGTRDTEEVRARIESLLGQAVPAIRPSTETPAKRSGLGRGLEVLLPESALDAVPAQLRAATESRGGSIDRVAVVEAHGSVIVEIEDGSGNVFTSKVDGGGSIDRAVLDAVRQLLGVSGDTVLEVLDAVAERTDLVVVEALVGEAKQAGAAHVEFGRPYAVARAAHRALTSL